jgi:predicted enzyme related to lactoylglutathione lyase
MSGSAGELAQQEDLGTTGTFRTALLHTRDVGSAARFYGAVFGWQLQDGATPSFTLHGQRVAGIRRTTTDDNHDNLWVPYVAVDDVAAAAGAAVQAGGTIANSSIDPHDAGRRSVITDPEGAVIGLCTPADDQALTLTAGAGTIWWAEVLAQTPSVLQELYAHLFQWHSTEQPLAPHPLYVVWKRGEKAVGGLLPIGEDWNTSPRWQVLFQVDDLDAAVARVVAAGGTVEFGPLDVPRAGLLTSVRDPRGALHVLVQPHQK